MKYLFLILFTINFSVVFSQEKKKINNTIEKARDVYFNTRIDTQIVINNYNYPQKTDIIYLLYTRQMTITYYDSINNLRREKSITEFTFGNPDSAVINNVDFGINYSKAFDSAYFEKTLQETNGVFNSKNIRNSSSYISPDKKKISFKASYVGASAKIKIVVISKESGVKMTIYGVGKLF